MSPGQTVRQGMLSAVVFTLFSGLSQAAPQPRAAAADPVPLAPGQLLDRLSLTLRGVAPTASETADFTAQVSAHPDQFAQIYGALVDTYLASPGFAATVRQLHSVWWHLAPAESTALAEYIVTQDRPYFEVFGKDYVYLDGAFAPEYLLQGIATEEPLPTERGDWRAVRLAPTEGRFRSLLSNQDFLNTFPDTPTNKNRKRANQIFHTFLCETLAPTTPPKITPRWARPGAAPPPDPHGTDPNCIGCHYRLDPLARFFDRWRPPYLNTVATYFDSSQAAAGQLILPVPGGGHSDAGGIAETDLGKILIAEPRVHACVVQQVWTYFLGPSVILDPPTSAHLVATLDARQNFKDVVREVLSHPYFWSTENPPPPRFSDVKAALQVCTECHYPGGATVPAFDPGSYPFLADAGDNAKLLVRLWGAINHAPGFYAMPLAPIPALPADTLAQLRSWLAAGANDDAFNTTLTDAQIQEVLSDN